MKLKYEIKIGRFLLRVFVSLLTHTFAPCSGIYRLGHVCKLIFWWLALLFYAYFQGPTKAFVSMYFFNFRFLFKRVPPNIDQPAVFNFRRIPFWGRKMRPSLMSATSTRFEGSHPFLQMPYFIFFLLWWQLCIHKQASFWLTLEKVACWRKWSFYMSLVMFCV